MEQNNKSSTRTLLWAFFLGAISGILFSPRSGRATRQWIKQQREHLGAEGRRFLGRAGAQARYRTGMIEGVTHKIKDQFMPEKKLIKADDNTIEQRVRTALGEAPLAWQIPHVNINSENGIVTIRGPVKNQRDKNNAEKIALRVAGVKDVINKLKLVA